MIDFAEINEKVESITPTINKIRKESIEYLREVAKKNNGYFDLTEHDDFGAICVTYDGGNHPEYASNAFSAVQAVKLDGDKLVLETEDTDWYDTENVEPFELYGVAHFINMIIQCRETEG